MKDNEGGGSPIGGGGQPEPETQGRPPAVHGEQRLQALLDEAESEIADLEARVAELEGALAAAESSASDRERGRAIEHELTRAGAIDLEAAGLLLHAAIGDTPDPDIASAVRDLKGRKPFLFAPPQRATSASMGPADAGDELGDMATNARGSGDRAALLRYLRRRRAI